LIEEKINNIQFEEMKIIQRLRNTNEEKDTEDDQDTFSSPGKKTTSSKSSGKKNGNIYKK
jgi:hypothetical protein